MKIYFFIFSELKYKAFILILCALFYLGELVTAPLSMVTSTPKVCCEKMPKPFKPCHQASDCCAGCAMCAFVILPVVDEGAWIAPVFKVDYPAFTPSYVYLYHSSSWKPPGRA